MFDHLDRIANLGFNVDLTWNKNIEIVYDLEENSQPNAFDVRILNCSYNPFFEYSYEDIVESTCDFFYAWYNKNLELLKDYEIDPTDSNFDKLVDSCLGDVTQQVYRDYNIDSLLD